MRGPFLTSLLWKYDGGICNADPGDEQPEVRMKIPQALADMLNSKEFIRRYDEAFGLIATESHDEWLRRRNLKCAGIQHRAVAKESEELLKQAKANKPRNPFDQPFNDDPRLGSRK